MAKWLRDPSLTLLPESEWPERPTKAKVQVQRDEDWHECGSEMVNLGVLRVIEYQDIFAPKGVPCLNGGLGVQKKGEPGPGQQRICRFILNMIPSNEYLRPMSQDTSTLAPSTGCPRTLVGAYPPRVTRTWGLAPL